VSGNHRRQTRNKSVCVECGTRQFYRGRVWGDLLNLDYFCPINVYRENLKKKFVLLKKHYFCDRKKEKKFQGKVVFTTSSEKKCYKKFV
jgi:hypothetical protein